MEIVKTRDGGIVHLRLIGRLDNHWSQSLDEVLHESAREGVRHVRLDFSGVTYLSSAGAAVLLKHQKEAMAVQGSLEIAAASERARSTLRLMGFVELLVAGTSLSRRKTLSIPLPHESESAAYESRVLEGKKAVCSVIGKPDLQAQASSLSIYRDVFALGVGALGATPDECRDFYGEFVGAAGGAAFMPTDGTATPDYMLSTPMGFVPTIQALQAIAFRGAPSYQLRFEATSPEEGAPLSDIVRTALSLAGTPTAGIVMAADVTGLVCARLRRSPARSNGGVPFDFPAVRDWLSFTPEREFARFSALVVGVASASPSASLAPFLRPVSDEHQGHFHAVVTAFRSLPRGKLPVADIVAAWLQPRSVVSVVHLLRDARANEGAGESAFQRGLCWIFPIAEGAA